MSVERNGSFVAGGVGVLDGRVGSLGGGALAIGVEMRFARVSCFCFILALMLGGALV